MTSPPASSVPAGDTAGDLKHIATLIDDLKHIATLIDGSFLELLRGGPDQPDVGRRIRDVGGPYAVELAPGVTYAEAVVAAASAMLHGGFTTPEIEAPWLAADRARAQRAAVSAEFGGDLPDTPVRDLTPPQIAPAEDTPPAALPIGEIVRYQQLDAEVDRLTAELKEVKRQKNELEVQLVEAFTEAETSSTRVRGKTVHLQRTLVASKTPGTDTAQLVAALRTAGLEDLITKDTVMAQTLNAYVRELDKAGEDLPPALAGIVSKFEKFEVRVNTTGSNR